MMKQQKGITLLALVITIIVLIILASISINLIIGERNIFKLAVDSGVQYKISEYIDKVELARIDVTHVEGDDKGKAFLNELIDKIYEQKIVPEGSITKLDSKKAKMVTEEGYVYIITAEGIKYLGKADEIQQVEDVDFEVEEGNIEAKLNPEGWTNKEVKVGLKNNVGEDYTVEYSLNEGATWNKYEEEIEVEENINIYVRLKTGYGEAGNYGTIEIEKIEKVKPIINTNLNNTEKTINGMTMRIEATDEISGISKVVWYYKEAEESEYTEVEDEYTTMNGEEAGEKVRKELTHEFRELTSGGTYNIYAEVYDVAGNKTRTPVIGEVEVKLEHNYELASTTEATCTQKATETYTCTKCGDTYTVEIAEALGHDYTSQTATDTYLKSAATCTTKAVYYYKCSRCAEKGTNTYETGNALGHNYATATCTVAQKCTRCNATIGSALGHSWAQYNSSSHYCTRCSTTQSHNWSGTNSNTCSTCNYHYHVGSSSSGTGCYTVKRTSSGTNYCSTPCSSYTTYCSGCTPYTTTTYCSGCNKTYDQFCVQVYSNEASRHCSDCSSGGMCQSSSYCEQYVRSVIEGCVTGSTCPGHSTTSYSCPGHSNPYCPGHPYSYTYYDLGCGY